LRLRGGGGERRNLGGGGDLLNTGDTGTGAGGGGEGESGGGGLNTGDGGGGGGGGGDGGIAATTPLIQSLYAETLIKTERRYVPHGEFASGNTPYDTVPNNSGGETSLLYKGPPLSP
jgi:hypothetical protein